MQNVKRHFAKKSALHHKDWSLCWQKKVLMSARQTSNFPGRKNTTTRIFIAISLLLSQLPKGYYADNYVKSCVRYVMDHKNFLPTFSANL